MALNTLILDRLMGVIIVAMIILGFVWLQKSIAHARLEVRGYERFAERARLDEEYRLQVQHCMSTNWVTCENLIVRLELIERNWRHDYAEMIERWGNPDGE